MPVTSITTLPYTTMTPPFTPVTSITMSPAMLPKTTMTPAVTLIKSITTSLTTKTNITLMLPFMSSFTLAGQHHAVVVTPSYHDGARK
jgi:hypothetical protein